MNGRQKALATLIATGALAAAAVTLAPGSIGSGPERVTERVAASRGESACDLVGTRISQRGWRTDFSSCSAPLQEFRPGGPSRDGIPPLDQPRFESVGQAGAWLKPREPVIFVEVYGDARAYPLQILIWHEIVNDSVGGVPISVTFCPLCNTAIAFDRQIPGHTLDFGTTGYLRHSDLVMWDRQTESWWQQATGEAVVGELTGTRLQMVPASIVSWDEFQRQRPGGRVLSRDTGHRRDYGRNPYVGYDDVSQSPFLFEGRADGRLRPMERVVTVSIGGETVAYPFSRLRQRGVAADSVGGQPIVVFFELGTASALDGADMASSRDVGASAVYAADLDGQLLSFTWDGVGFADADTGSRWTLLGQAVSGVRAGAQLRPIPHMDAFWFASAAFHPQIRIWEP